MSEGLDLRVNFSDQEASSEAMSFDPIPTGTYYARITDIELRQSKSEKNLGKPYWNVEFTIQDGKFADRKVWSNVMLFDGALYTLAQLCKAALGLNIESGEFVIPSADAFISKEVNVVVKRQRDAFAEDRDADGEPQWKNEVKGIQATSGTVVTTALGSSSSGSDSLLP
jgi:hypothetical protein